MDEEVGEWVGWHEIEKGYWARVGVGFLVTLVELRTPELVLGGDEVVGADVDVDVDADADAEVGMGGQAIVVDRIGLGVHQKRMAGTRDPHAHVKSADVIN
jgi:hypothetical protein